eukprot:scaffold24270_cov112-Isochrysis_galbana.AAC.7
MLGRHRGQQLHGLLPSPGARERRERRVERDGRRGHAERRHLLQDVERQLPPASLTGGRLRAWVCWCSSVPASAGGSGGRCEVDGGGGRESASKEADAKGGGALAEGPVSVSTFECVSCAGGVSDDVGGGG